VRIGRPIDVGRYRDRHGDRLVLRQITDELMYEVRALSGQRYVDEYATRRSERLPTPAVPLSTAGHHNGRNHVHGDGDVELVHSGTMERPAAREASTVAESAPTRGRAAG
jgi:1-acyl-sn-glycerol-3-phosphate acyltransferase